MQNKQQQKLTTLYRLICRNNVERYKLFRKISTLSVLTEYYTSFGSGVLRSILTQLLHVLHVIVGSYYIITTKFIQHKHFRFIERSSSKVSCLKTSIMPFERINTRPSMCFIIPVRTYYQRDIRKSQVEKYMQHMNFNVNFNDLWKIMPKFCKMNSYICT